MKKLTIPFLLLFAFIFSGCTTNTQIELLEQQNQLLQKQLEQQQTLETSYDTTSYPNDTYEDTYEAPTTNYENNSTTNYDNYDTSNTSCCKICNKGKACGDSCISRDYTCHKGVGCACDG